MSIYTVVDEGYDIDVYRTQKAVCEAMARQNLYIVDIGCDDDDSPATAADIAKALRKDGVVRLAEEPGDRDWKFRVEKNTPRN